MSDSLFSNSKIGLETRKNIFEIIIKSLFNLIKAANNLMFSFKFVEENIIEFLERMNDPKYFQYLTCMDSDTLKNIKADICQLCLSNPLLIKLASSKY